jgi:hypothetical protein
VIREIASDKPKALPACGDLDLKLLRVTCRRPTMNQWTLVELRQNPRRTPERTMRIAQIAPLAESVPPKLYGGTERVVSWLTEELVGLGHEVTWQEVITRLFSANMQRSNDE